MRWRGTSVLQILHSLSSHCAEHHELTSAGQQDRCRRVCRPARCCCQCSCCSSWWCQWCPADRLTLHVRQAHLLVATSRHCGHILQLLIRHILAELAQLGYQVVYSFLHAADELHGTSSRNAKSECGKWNMHPARLAALALAPLLCACAGLEISPTIGRAACAPAPGWRLPPQSSCPLQSWLPTKWWQWWCRRLPDRLCVQPPAAWQSTQQFNMGTAIWQCAC